MLLKRRIFDKKNSFSVRYAGTRLEEASIGL